MTEESGPDAGKLQRAAALELNNKTKTAYWQKLRRNNRILAKFYDAAYIGLRDGNRKKGVEISCGRTRRCESRHGTENERKYRAHKVKKGHMSVRRKRCPI